MEHLDPGAVWFGKDFRKGDRAVILATEEHEGKVYVFFNLIYREDYSGSPSVHFWSLEYLEDDFYPVDTRLVTERWPLDR